MDRIVDLVAKLERGSDARQVVEEARALVAEVLEFHREGLVRLTEAMPKSELAEAARDPLVASLLDLHGIDAPAPPVLLPAKDLLRRAQKASAATTLAHDEETIVCDLCGAHSPGSRSQRHAHLVDVATTALVCTCLACAAGFDAAGDKYARVPEGTSRRATALAGDDAWWRLLGVPTGLAFFVPRRGGPPRVYYPGAVGAIESTVPDGAWQSAVAAHAVLGTIEPHVEALLVDRIEGGREHWIVGVDRCYELVAKLRESWRGFTGGDEAREVRRRFWATLAREIA